MGYFVEHYLRGCEVETTYLVGDGVGFQDIFVELATVDEWVHTLD
jgi:hypothetical protein